MGDREEDAKREALRAYPKLSGDTAAELNFEAARRLAFVEGWMACARRDDEPQLGTMWAISKSDTEWYVAYYALDTPKGWSISGSGSLFSWSMILAEFPGERYELDRADR